MKRWALVVAAVALCASFNAFGAVWYVDKDNTPGPWDGTSWATAHKTIQEGIDAAYAAGGGEVWVADGSHAAAVEVELDPSAGLRDGRAGARPYRATERRCAGVPLADWASEVAQAPVYVASMGDRVKYDLLPLMVGPEKDTVIPNSILMESLQ